MCVQTANKPWERPAVREDIPVLSQYFHGIDFEGALKAMSLDGCVPLATDLVLLGATLSGQADDLGIKFLPFSAIDVPSRTSVKIPEMDNIVEWMENTALGSYMWQRANDWMEQNHGCRLEFAMNCGCGSVRSEHYVSGNWRRWVQRFNEIRQTVYGRTNVERRNSISGTTMTEAQRMMWKRIRTTLEALPAVAEKTEIAELVANAA
jgi:hypothetical protein